MQLIAEYENMEIKKTQNIELFAQAAWQKIAPCWEISELVAVNPLQGFEIFPIEQAIAEASVYFQASSPPQPMLSINRETIKWCQAFFDLGQASIPMPSRHLGLYAAWIQLAYWDKRLHLGDKKKRVWLKSLSLSPLKVIAACLDKLNIFHSEAETFLTLLLTTLPGWAAYVKYQAEWALPEKKSSCFVTLMDYLAMRMVITCLLWSEAKELLVWHRNEKNKKTNHFQWFEGVQQKEENDARSLLKKIQCSLEPEIKKKNNVKKNRIPLAQFVFCIDIRSEPFRRALEVQGDYETFGFAGFFGIPVQIENTMTGESHASCPVLIRPKHKIKKIFLPHTQKKMSFTRYLKKSIHLKKIYQSLKYNFTTPFILADAVGWLSGISMILKTFFPGILFSFQAWLLKNLNLTQCDALTVEDIPEKDQLNYAETALRMMGFTQTFSSWVIFCGHGSNTKNNAYAAALNCGACGGHSGENNARILAYILNKPRIREQLNTKGICIPHKTRFISALHHTTTDEVILQQDAAIHSSDLEWLKKDLQKATELSSHWRCQTMNFASPLNLTSKGAADENQGISDSHTHLNAHLKFRSLNWSEVRPEWGLARHASFIVAPRGLTQEISLEGRAFLHSYDWEKDDEQGTFLTAILTAPMIVAQWINAQYFFSTWDNVAYGAGSKLTQNITGKIGIMQGNASDWMNGLPLQSVYQNDEEAYHQLQRLLTFVYAPLGRLDSVIASSPLLKKLFSHGWINLACLDPSEHHFYWLKRDLTWSDLSNGMFEFSLSQRFHQLDEIFGQRSCPA